MKWNSSNQTSFHFGWNTMREINFLPRRNEVWIRNVTPHFFVLWFISFKAIWKELFLKKINIYAVLIFIKVIGSKTSFQNHQPSKLHFVSGVDEKRKFSWPASKSAWNGSKNHEKNKGSFNGSTRNKKSLSSIKGRAL